MAKRLLQEYFDRAQAAEQATLQLKIQLSTEPADFEMERAGRSSDVDDYCHRITRLVEQLAEKERKIVDLEKTIEDTKSQAPSNLVSELKGMLKAAVEKVEELELRVAAPASTTTAKEEPENDISAVDYECLKINLEPKKKGSGKKRFATRPLVPGWPHALRKANGDGYVGPVRTGYVPPHLRTREQDAALAIGGFWQ
ncbi:hypothetical protein LTR56_019211 [Elasticomyces elasticus]|nr:hypothetical protein LTR56_019211 [Elasticomyces elasticus]KAK3633219.1 hypothetical protein LTR22_020219 [Elasticomyces elasticus]KAK4910622.1 hypothetical protein LTR49_020754 [Elasticomyces elasticus]KAK5751033.1 hypothetical protein LTS12_018934 [Elasticomyces elasticus]